METHIIKKYVLSQIKDGWSYWIDVIFEEKEIIQKLIITMNCLSNFLAYFWHKFLNACVLFVICGFAGYCYN